MVFPPEYIDFAIKTGFGEKSSQARAPVPCHAVAWENPTLNRPIPFEFFLKYTNFLYCT